jgi:hypothetical protein
VADAILAPAFAVESTDCSGIRQPDAIAELAAKIDVNANTEIVFFMLVSLSFVIPQSCQRPRQIP